MNCNTEIHNEMVKVDYIDCSFCDQQLQQPSTIYLTCCEKQDMINNKGTNVCRNYGTVHSYGIASEYVDFYENKHRFAKKSVYQRKYHLDNVLNDITCKNRSAERTCMGFDLVLFHSVGKPVLNVSIRELKYYK